MPKKYDNHRKIQKCHFSNTNSPTKAVATSSQLIMQLSACPSSDPKESSLVQNYNFIRTQLILSVKTFQMHLLSSAKGTHLYLSHICV